MDRVMIGPEAEECRTTEPEVKDGRRDVRGYGLIIDARRIAWLLFAGLAVLLLMFAAGKFSTIYLHHDNLFGLLPRIHPYYRATLPTWFATSCLLIIALILATIAGLKKSRGEPYVLHWTILAATFLLFSMERSTGLLREVSANVANRLALLNVLRVFGSLEVTLILVLALILFGFYRNLWGDLPRKPRNLITAAAIAFLAGRIVLQFVQSSYLARHPDILVDPRWVVLVTTRLALETSAIILLLWGLLEYLAAEAGVLSVHLLGATGQRPQGGEHRLRNSTPLSAPGGRIKESQASRWRTFRWR